MRRTRQQEDGARTEDRRESTEEHDEIVMSCGGCEVGWEGARNVSCSFHSFGHWSAVPRSKP